MNLLCPNCQKMLMVPEQYAGQRMQCPLCSSQFTVPALPSVPASSPMNPTEPGSAPGADASAAFQAAQTLLTPAPAAAPDAEVYGLAPQPPPPAPPPPPP